MRNGLRYEPSTVTPPGPVSRLPPSDIFSNNSLPEPPFGAGFPAEISHLSGFKVSRNYNGRLYEERGDHPRL
jgi:hypothetical protein